MDWNNNGHKDSFDILTDDFLFDEMSSQPTGIDSGGCLKGFIVAFIIIILLGMIGSSCNKESDTDSYNSSYSDYDYTTMHYTTVPHTTYSYNSHKSYKSPAKSYSDYDEYDAKKYSDAEDFYDDHYEDFDDYEDAENYYDDYGYW